MMQAVSVLLGLGVGTVGDLQRDAVLKAGQHEAERLIFATGEHAGTLVGRVSQFCRDLVDALKGFGAHLLRMVEGVRYSAQRDTASLATSLMVTVVWRAWGLQKRLAERGYAETYIVSLQNLNLGTGAKLSFSIEGARVI